MENTMSENTVADLIGHAAEQSPEAFRQTFDQLMHDRVVAALDVKKQEIASSYFADEIGDEEGEEDINVDTEENEDTDGQDAETDA
jgi:hypothetical protein